MAGASPILGFVSLIILAGGIVFQFFVILSGGVQSNPLNQIYFLQADTNNIANAQNPARWTFFALCGVENGRNANCGSAKPAFPFDPPRNFGTTENVPGQFIGTHQYYYLSRFMFAFYIIALFFAVVALFTGLLALCSRLGGVLSGFTTSLALFFQALAAALMTAWVVRGRNAFNSNGQSASIGVKAFAFTWSAFACFLIATVLFCSSGATGGGRHTSRRRSSKRRHSAHSRNRGSFIEKGYASS